MAQLEQRLANEPAALAKIADRWISAPDSAAKFADMAALPRAIQPMLQAANPLDLGLLPVTREVADGRPVYVLRDPEGSPQAQIVIAASGPPYLLRLVAPANGEVAQTTLTDYGAYKPIAAPVGAETVEQALTS